MKTTKNEKIPKFKSLEEEAKFWDTHDTSDYIDRSKKIKVTFKKTSTKVINIRMNIEDLSALRTMAQGKGLGPTTLARMWVKERLEEEKN
jgi:predicted DNA binding CopG/RHH family protein